MAARFINPDEASQNPQSVQAQLTDAQRQDFVDRFAPVEDQIITAVDRNIEPEAARAGKEAGKQFDITRGAFLRDLQRSGITLDARGQRQVDRSQGLSRALSVATAKNTTRQALTEENLQRKADLIGIGKGITAAANDSLSQASNLQARREDARVQGATARKSQNINTGATLAGLALGAVAFL